MPAILVEEAGYSESLAGFVTSLFSIVGMASALVAPLVLAQAVESVSSRHSGVVTGIIMGVPWLVTGFAYPSMLGFIRDATGSYAGGFLVVAIVTFFLWRPCSQTSSVAIPDLGGTR